MEWTVHPHDEIREAAPGLWYVDGTLGRSPLPRRMVMWRLPSGGLWIHSAINLDDAGMKALEALGPPEILVVPNGYHRADAAAWKARFPKIQVVAPKVARGAVEKVVPVDALCEDVLPEHGIACMHPDGVGEMELVYKVPIDDGHALIVTDLLFNIREHMPGPGGFFARYLTRSTGFFGMTGLGRLLGLRDGAAFAAWLRGQADDPELRIILVAHGDPILENAADALREAADRH